MTSDERLQALRALIRVMNEQRQARAMTMDEWEDYLFNAAAAMLYAIHKRWGREVDVIVFEMGHHLRNALGEVPEELAN